MKQLNTQHEPQIIGVLKGWDRVRFRGTLRILSCVKGLFVWMLEQKVLLKEFAGVFQRSDRSFEAIHRGGGECGGAEDRVLGEFGVVKGGSGS